MFKIDDVTIQTCWDADRLDLWRIGIEPRPEYLYTEMAKKTEMIELAREIERGSSYGYRS